MDEYQNMERQTFLNLIKLNLEAEYNAPGKPESARDVDKDKIKAKFSEMIDKYIKTHNLSKEDLINKMIMSIDESREVNPKSVEEQDTLQEILSEILDDCYSKTKKER